MAADLKTADIGVYGLGTMGSALALNLAEQGFRVAVSNREADWIAPFLDEAGPLAGQLSGHATLEDFVDSIAQPRSILFMIPSGAPMDAMIDAVMPLLDEGDTIIDGGNADFHDTRRRAAAFDGTGRHFVKTVHNGIEYADMQMIAEVYGLLRDAGGQTAPQIGALFESWQKGPLSSYLIEVSAAALQTVDVESGTPMVDLILDKAGQKGTGRWTLIEALKLGQSASSIEAAVGARGWSSEKALRVAAAPLLPDAVTGGTLPTEEEMKSALLAARILGHAQGFRVLSAASDEFGWQLDMARIAEIWRAGCIIRSALLDDLADAFHAGLPEGALILAPAIRDMLGDHLAGLRKTVAAGVSLGVPMPALSASLAWYDSIRTARGSANLIQAQRDFFGAHGFERGDIAGAHHGTWNAIRRD